MSTDSDGRALAKAIAVFIALERIYKTAQHHGDSNDDSGDLSEEALSQSQVSSLFIDSFAEITGIPLDTFILGLIASDSAVEVPSNAGGGSDSRSSLHEDRGSPKKLQNAQALMQVARAYCQNGEFMFATKIFGDIGRYLVGHNYPFPGGYSVGVEYAAYQALPDDYRQAVMACCRELADCCTFTTSKTQNFPNALGWLYEVELLIKNQRYGGGLLSHLHDWSHFSGSTLPPPLALLYIETMIAKAEIFMQLGNTSANQHFLTMANETYHSLPPRSEDTRLLAALELLFRSRHKDLYRLRHPDPQSNQRFSIVDEQLQIRGAWKKLDLKADTSHLAGKTSYEVFIWNGYLYMVRGWILSNVQHRIGPHTVQRLHMKRLDKWEFVTTCPAIRGENVLNRVSVHKDKMYSFMGHPIIDVLDLTNNRWSTLKTTYKSNAADRRAGIDPMWPWPRKMCTDTTQCIVDGRLFVFGGINGKNMTGSNLFMELDLKTLKWRRLSGTPMVLEYHDPRIPGPRSSAGSWVSRDQKKVYIFSGSCGRVRPGLCDNKYGPEEGWMYDDLWSWDIDTRVWREEKLCGNTPAPRSSMGCIYSKKLDKVVVFGGSNQKCSGIIGESFSESRSYSVAYGDTFVWNPPTPTQASDKSTLPPYFWQQVQTIGFPTYRSSCHLVEDPDTGDIYLYGGQALGETLPSKNHSEVERSKKAKHDVVISEKMSSFPELAEALDVQDIFVKRFSPQFTDIWKLHIDLPGGDFESINLEGELRTAPLGPWQRCFECLKTGFWKKCGGSCAGRTFFCSSECQAKGWKEHKRIHGCKKIVVA